MQDRLTSLQRLGCKVLKTQEGPIMGQATLRFPA